MFGLGENCYFGLMDAKPGPKLEALPDALLVSRTIAEGEGWRISDIVCRSGPENAPFEERHENVCIAAVTAGTFQYHSSAGRALLYPGAFLLGNAGTCFTCGHSHGRGDRCISFHYAPAFFEEISATAAGSSGFRFAIGKLPAGTATMSAALLAIGAALQGPLAVEEAAVRMAEAVIASASGHMAGDPAVSARDERRISATLRAIEARAHEPLDLKTLAGFSAMSKYHFLRSFRRITGLTPYQYVLGLRLRRAAAALATTAKPVIAIALEAGFGDISTFNAQFHRAFGRSPSALRRDYPF